MIKEVFAPVVKTLFIPEGNPGVQEVKEIRAVPRVIQADGDAQEITVSGEMDLSIRYVPINDSDDEIPWRTIQFEENDLDQRENEEQVIARLESALKEDQNEEDDEEKGEDRWFRIDISVPFTLAIDTDGLCRDHIVRLDPCIHSSNWFVVGPKAIEFEAILQLTSQEEARETGITEEKPTTIIQTGGIIQEEDSRVTNTREEEHIEQELRVEVQKEQESVAPQEFVQHQEIVQQQEFAEEQESQKKREPLKIQKPIENQKVIEEKIIEQKQMDQSLKQEERGEEEPRINSKIIPLTKPMVKSEEKTEIDRHRYLVEKGFFQMKFYRVQLGEDLDAIADRFGIPRERISTHNSINEEEIRTGLLLSIPRS